MCSFSFWDAGAPFSSVRPPMGKPKLQYTKSQLAILQHYVAYLQMMSIEELPNRFITDSADLKEISEAYAQELKKYVFTLPRLKKLPETLTGINKYRSVKEFISFLARFLYHKPDSIIDSCGAQINSLEKELRFLLTVLGDRSLMVCADDDVLAEFEAVADVAGCFAHSLLFRTDGAFAERDEGAAVVLNHIILLKANIRKLLDVVPACMSRSTYVSTSVVESRLIFDLLVRDLEDIMNRDDDDDDDVKDQIRTLHQGLICLQPFIGLVIQFGISKSLYTTPSILFH